MLFLVSLVCQ